MNNLFTAFRNCKLEIRNSRQSRAGFTLIELLVVIGILGVLASALVATIDPLEQIKKAQDSNVKNVLVEINNGMVRYFTVHNVYPWDPAGITGGGCNSATAPTKLVMYTGGVVSNCVTVLQADNELKQAFSTDAGDLSKVFITFDSTNNLIIGCFLPQSKSQQNDANTKYDEDGTVHVVNPKDCSTTNGLPNNATGGCFWCTR